MTIGFSKVKVIADVGNGFCAVTIMGPNLVDQEKMGRKK